MDPVKRQDALFEIGTEEIPASYLPPALEAMRVFCENFLKEKRLGCESVRAWGTPRRLALVLSGLPAKSDSATEESLGPSLTAARDAQGQWTAAARGFAQSRGLRVEDLKVRETPKGPYVCGIRRVEGVKAEKVLAELLEALVPAVPFPKKMVWNETGLRFARPIRNLVALYGGKPLRVSVAGVKASNKTFGLPHLGAGGVLIRSPQAYAATMKDHCVLVDPAARRKSVEQAVSQLSRKVKGQPGADEALLEEVTWLVEHPVGVLGDINPEFLQLPAEILVTCMRKHQKFFSILDARGNLLPHFVGIRNGMSEHQEIVRQGYEKVLGARLTDARFFQEEDLKHPLDYFVEKCAQIGLNEALGTMRDKIERVKAVARFLLQELAAAGVPADPGTVERAAHLSKFDLTTKMVYELPELQGAVGEHYARAQGEPEPVARAIREHYYPVTNQGPLPASPESAVLALADKLEGLAGNFWIGIVPSGSADPYGLRRASTGVVRILLQNQWNLSLGGLIGKILELFGPDSERRSTVARDLRAFLLDRFQLQMQDAGYELDEIYAVAKNASEEEVRTLRTVTLRDKISAVRQARGHPDFAAVAEAFKRAGNILKQARQKSIAFAPDQFNASLVREPQEGDLSRTVEWLEDSNRPLLESRRYGETLQNLVSVREKLNSFFDKVMVMDPDPEVCRNRLSLLSRLEAQFRRMADFSQIQGRGGAN